MTSAVKERIATDLNKVKSEGSTRASRIREILQTAFTQTVAEVKAGSTEIGSVAKDAIADAQSTDQFANLKEQYHQKSTGLQARWVMIDEKLAEKYGDRYQQVKQQLGKYWSVAQAWYTKTKTEVTTGTPDPIQRMHIELGAKMAEAGEIAARKEQETKQRLILMLKKEAETEVSDAE